jgi:hypothetical protein
MTTISVTRPAPVVEPRGALWSAEVAARILNGLGSLFERDARHAERNNRAAEAAEVRRLADEVREVDPRVAADLYAAADRHLAD